MATHSLVTIPLVSHSQKRKKWLVMGCRSTERCACERWRKMVTAAMVIWVSPSVTATYPHHGRSNKPNCMFLFQGPGNRIMISHESPTRLTGFGDRSLRTRRRDETDDALRDGDLDPGGLEAPPDRPVDAGTHIVPLARVTNPHSQFQHDAILGEFLQQPPGDCPGRRESPVSARAQLPASTPLPAPDRYRR